MTHCTLCATAGDMTPATHLHVDSARIIREGFGWTMADALSAGYGHDDAYCDGCYGQLPHGTPTQPADPKGA